MWCEGANPHRPLDFLGIRGILGAGPGKRLTFLFPCSFESKSCNEDFALDIGSAIKTFSANSEVWCRQRLS